MMKQKPAIDPAARENQLIAAAIDLAERQLIEGTASSQIITHYLKLATEKEKLEREILEKQKNLLDAKVEAIKSESRDEEMYENAIKYMKAYSGDEQTLEELDNPEEEIW